MTALDNSDASTSEAESDGELPPGPDADGHVASLTTRSMVWHTGFNIVTFVIISATGFFVTPYVLHHVGANSFGVYSLGVTLSSLVALLDFGLGIATMKLIADRADDQDRHGSNQIVSSVFAAYLVAGTVFTLIALSVAVWGAGLFHIPAGHRHEFEVCLSLAAVTVGITFPQSIFTAVLNGRRDYATLNVILLSSTAISIVGTIALLSQGYGIISIFVFGLCLALVQFAVKGRLVDLRHRVRVNPRQMSTQVLRGVAPLAGWILVINIGTKVILDLDVLVAGLVLGPLAVAAYQVATSLAMVIRRTAEQLNVVTLTAGSALWARRDLERLRGLFLEANRVTAILLFPAFALTWVFGRRFLELWVGDQVGHRAASSLVVLAAAMAVIAVQASSAQVLIAVGRQRIVAITTIVEATANVVLSIVLAHSLGVVGVAIGTLVPSVVTTILVFAYFAVRSLGLSLRQLTMSLAPITLQTAVIAGFGRALSGKVEGISMPMLLLMAAVSYAVWVASNLLLVPTSRRRYLAALQARRSTPVSI